MRSWDSGELLSRVWTFPLSWKTVKSCSVHEAFRGNFFSALPPQHLIPAAGAWPLLCHVLWQMAAGHHSKRGNAWGCFQTAGHQETNLVSTFSEDFQQTHQSALNGCLSACHADNVDHADRMPFGHEKTGQQPYLTGFGVSVAVFPSFSFKQLLHIQRLS